MTATSPPVSDANAAVYLESATGTAGDTADLAVHLTRTPPTVPIGGSFSETVTVTNNGPADSGPYSVALLLWHCLSGSDTDGDTSHRAAVVFTDANLAAGDSVRHKVVLTVAHTANAKVYVKALVLGAVPDPKAANDFAAVHLRVA